MAKQTKKIDKEKKIAKKKSKVLVPSGMIYIQSTFNNTLVTVTDETGNVIAWSTSGVMGFKGAKKSTPYASQLTVANVMEKAKARGFNRARVFVSGVGSGRDSAVRALAAAQIQIESIKDITPEAHNGCRQKKARRI
ncbi:MAG: 30S ribosomal protein S11 [Candidatus Berkelbacteria bacterium]